MPYHTSYNLSFVLLSVMLSTLSAYVAVAFASRVTFTTGRYRMAWLAGGATSMGIGIWSMHYVGMLAFLLPIPVTYHVPTVLLSLFAAILASLVALSVVSRRRLGMLTTAVASLVMGGGIAAMHYIGMAAMRLSAHCQWSSTLVIVSILLAVVISMVALFLIFELRDDKPGKTLKKKHRHPADGGSHSGYALHRHGRRSVHARPGTKPYRPGVSASLFWVPPALVWALSWFCRWL